MTNGEILASRLIKAVSDEKILSIAVDGETFGHHKKFGDMALAYCIRKIQKDPNVQNSIYSHFLENNTPNHEVHIIQNSSWSCAHKVGRWSDDCGCNINNFPNWNQKWRKPLREAIDLLRDTLASFYEEKMSLYFKDPWEIRNNYIELILNRSEEAANNFLKKYCQKDLSEEEKISILKLLEMQRHLMLSYTSCGWFFDDISGIESMQILSFAARVLQLAKELNSKFSDLEESFINILELAKSNIKKNGAYLYKTFILPQVLDLTDIAVDFIISSFFEQKKESSLVYIYSIITKFHKLLISEEKKLSFGKIFVSSKITLDKKSVYFVALLYSEHEVVIGLSEKKEDFFNSLKEIQKSFKSKNFQNTINLIKKTFVSHDFSFWSLFKEDQRHILKKLFCPAIFEIEKTLDKVHNLHYSIMKDLKDKKIPIPQIIIKSLDLALNAELTDLLSEKDLNLLKLEEITNRILEWKFAIDLNNITFLATKKLEHFIKIFSQDYNILYLQNFLNLYETLSFFNLPWNLWKAQNLYFKILKSPQFQKIKVDTTSFEKFKIVGKYLKVKVEEF